MWLTTDLHHSARLFTGSLESAIYLLSSICSVPSHTSVLPAINTSFTHHISVGLANGTTITGQNSISHPSHSSALDASLATPASTLDEVEHHDRIEDANLPGSLPTLRKQYIAFSKAHEEDLPARIQRLWYINPFGQEIRLAANPAVLAALDSAQAVIYSIGSLYTSIVPSLVLKGIGAALANPQIRYKILILNSTLDRETGPSSAPYETLDFVAAIAKAGANSKGVLETPPEEEYREYVTHVIHLVGPGTPAVDKERLRGLGIEAIRVYGRRNEGEGFVRYDERGLIQALEVTMGKRDPRVVSRRNTMMEGSKR
jgi:2-phospho-L-lactate transferase/gluconeogenesis factor (CofD/UPF0052 family)